MLPNKIISDRDPRFTSHFGKALAQELGIKWNLSTAFHPQTDGLSEWKNQWIEQYLHLMASNKEEWSELLPLATLVHNNSRNSATRLAPNQLLIGAEPTTIPYQATGGDNPLAEERVQKLREWRVLANEALQKATEKQPGETPPFRVRQKVWLEAKNLTLSHGMPKISPKRHGPFEIEKEISSVAYKLRLPPQWRIHPVFHASLLLPYQETKEHGPNYTRPPPELIDNEEQYEVEAIRTHRRQG